ncbi:hypothetical protein PC123_g26883, partial [Phytophthora cactorum]
MPRWSFVLALAALASIQVCAAPAHQRDFAACPVRHSLEYYCCEYSEDVKVLYTKYNRPSGGDYETYYVDGWSKQRQVNFPFTMYHPSTPTFNYTDPSTVCGVQAVVNKETGKITEELQCAESNSSLTVASQDTTVFWTYKDNWRNNNASFPVGANCYSLMLRDGTVDMDLKTACATDLTVTMPPVRFTTFMETPLVTTYLLYMSFFALLGVWKLYRLFHQRDKQLANDIDKKLLATSQTFAKLAAGETYGRRTSIRVSDVQMQAAASEDIQQIGFSYSTFGSFVFGCLVIASVEDNALVFIIVWVITAIWFVVIVSMQDRIFNFFRLRVPLD